MKKEHDDSIKRAFETKNEAETSYGLSIWFGAIFFYLVNLGKRPFADFHTEKQEYRNAITGYLLTIFVVGTVMYVLYRLIMQS